MVLVNQSEVRGVWSEKCKFGWSLLRVWIDRLHEPLAMGQSAENLITEQSLIKGRMHVKSGVEVHRCSEKHTYPGRNGLIIYEE